MYLNQPKLLFLVFCVASGMRFDVNLGVRIPLGELLAFVSIPFMTKSIKWDKYSSRLGAAFAVLGIWIFGIVVSDAINGIPFAFFVKGLAKPIWCGLWMLFFIIIINDDYRALYVFPAGLVVAGLQNYFFPREWTEHHSSGEYEAVAFALVPLLQSVTICVASFFYSKLPLLSPLTYIIGGILMALIGVPRSIAAIILLISLILASIWYLKFRQINVYKIPARKVILFGTLFLVAGLAIFEVYVWSASNGLLGEAQQEKLEEQSNTILGDSLPGLLLGGRTEVFAAILAIMDQPLTGYGSWQARTLSDYFLEAVLLVGTDTTLYQRLIKYGSPGAGHSILFALWAENGLLAAIALGIIEFWVLKELLNIVFKNNPLAPLFVFMGIFFTWGFFFSPFGIDARLAIGLFLALRVTQFCKWPPGINHISSPLKINRKVVRERKFSYSQLFANRTEHHHRVQSSGHNQSCKPHAGRVRNSNNSPPTFN